MLSEYPAGKGRVARQVRQPVQRRAHGKAADQDSQTASARGVGSEYSERMRAKASVLLTVLCMILSGTIVAQEQGQRVLYDRAISPSTGSVVPAHQKLLTPQALSTLPGACRDTRITLLLARTGVFVTPGQQDALYLYGSECDDSLRHLIVRANRVLYNGVLNEGFPVNAFVEGYAVKDIDQDGRQEFVTVFSYADGIAFFNWLTIWTPVTLPRTGAVGRSAAFITEKATCAPVDDTFTKFAGASEHWVISVIPGPQPKFSADAFLKSSCGDDRPYQRISQATAPLSPSYLRRFAPW